MDWMFKMAGRVAEGEPPVSEAEFAELATWFAAHDAELTKVEPLAMRDGRLVWCADMRYDLAKGPRAIGAGRVAEEIRRLKGAYAVQSPTDRPLSKRLLQPYRVYLRWPPVDTSIGGHRG